MAHRILQRQSNGQYRQASLQRDYGISPNICPHCRSFNPVLLGQPRPVTCANCGESLAVAALSPTPPAAEKSRT